MLSPIDHPRFELRRRLGEGGQGVVWAAFDRERGIEVALKTLRKPGASAVLRLKQEFRALRDVSHENLLALHDLIVDDEHCFFTMELCDGVDVVRWIRGESATRTFEPTETGSEVPSLRPRPHAQFDESRLRSALAQLSAGLLALHAHGMVHRDLKPSNVLARRDGQVFLLDYGLVTDSTHAGDGFEGTAAYAAPEQARGEIGPNADAYALGVILFEAITGALPFSGTPLQMLVDKRQREAPQIDALVEGVPPDLVALVASLLSRDPEARRLPTRAHHSDTPLIGRERELSLLEEALESGGRTVVVEGPSGIGKTSLVRTFLGMARARGAVVMEGRCNPRERVPYNAFDGVIDALARELHVRGMTVPEGAVGRLFPVLGAPPASLDLDVDALRRRAFGELRALFERFSRLLIFVDDFQWADRDSRALLAELAKSPALFLLTQRSDALPLPWSALRIELAPLSHAASRELLGLSLGHRLVDVEAMLRVAEGHPLFLQELARADATETPRDLEQALASRIHALPREGTLLVQLAAVAASPVPPQELAAAARAPVASTLRAVDALRADRLLRVTDAGVEPFHDRVRDAALALLGDDELRDRHRALATALHDPRGVVHHLAGAGDRDAAREGALAAARRAEESLAFEDAALLLRDAIAYGADGDDVKKRLADALAHARRGVEAAEVYLSISGSGRTRARARAAELLLASGDITRGRAIVEELLARVDRPLPETNAHAMAALVRERVGLSLRGFVPRRGPVDARAAERADLFRGVAQGLGMADNLRAALYNARALRAALDLGDPVRAAIALATESIFRGSVDARKPRDLLARARSLAEETGDETARAWVAGADATLDALALERPDVLSGLDRAEAYFQERTLGNGWALDSIKLVRALSQLLLGQIEALRARLPDDIADARRRGDRYLETTLRRGATRVWLCDGDVLRANDALDESAWTSFRDGFHLQHWLELEGRAEIALYEGRAERTLDRHREELSALRTSLVARLQRPRVLARSTRGKLLLARAVHLRDRAALLECTWLASRLWSEELGYARVRASFLRAAIAAIRGDESTRASALRDVLPIADRAGLALSAAVARRRLGALLGGDEGRTLRAASDAWMTAERIADPERIADVEAPFA